MFVFAFYSDIDAPGYILSCKALLKLMQVSFQSKCVPADRFTDHRPYTDRVTTTCRPHTDDIPTTYRLRADYVPTMYRLRADDIPTAYRPRTDRVPTTYRLLADHVPTTYRPGADHMPITYRPLFIQRECMLQNMVCSFQGERELMKPIIPEDHQSAIFDNLIQATLESFIGEGEVPYLKGEL